jgi:hypothetical protein
MANVHYSLRLDMNGSTELLSGPRNDHEVAGRHVVFSLHYLSDRADCVDDGSARRIGHELRQRFQGTTTIGIAGEREHIAMIGIEAGNRSLQQLYQPLIEQRDAGRCLGVSTERRYTKPPLARRT